MISTYFKTQFPEDLYLPEKSITSSYMDRCNYGFDHISRKRLTIGFLARDIETILPYTIERLLYLGRLFNSCHIACFENDSVDSSKEILQLAAKKYSGKWPNDGVTFSLISSDMGKEKNIQDKSLGRRERMASYRNSLREEMLKHVADYYMVYDGDIEGGFSYEGIANSFSYDWDVCGSNSIIYKSANEKTQRYYYDSWAWRDLDNWESHEDSEINPRAYHRGEKPIEVNSCFGGLALYKHNNFSCPSYSYTSDDCDHVTFHKQMRNDKCNIFMNPSQLTLYSKSRYVD